MAGPISSPSSDATAVAGILLARKSGADRTTARDNGSSANASQLGLSPDTWKKIDRNGDGFVDKAELSATLEQKVPAAELAAFRKKAESKRPAEGVATVGTLMGAAGILSIPVTLRLGFGAFVGSFVVAGLGALVATGGLVAGLFKGGLGKQEKAIMDKLN